MCPQNRESNKKENDILESIREIDVKKEKLENIISLEKLKKTNQEAIQEVQKIIKKIYDSEMFSKRSEKEIWIGLWKASGSDREKQKKLAEICGIDFENLELNNEIFDKEDLKKNSIDVRLPIEEESLGLKTEIAPSDTLTISTQVFYKRIENEIETEVNPQKIIHFSLSQLPKTASTIAIIDKEGNIRIAQKKKFKNEEFFCWENTNTRVNMNDGDRWEIIEAEYHPTVKNFEILKTITSEEFIQEAEKYFGAQYRLGSKGTLDKEKKNKYKIDCSGLIARASMAGNALPDNIETIAGWTNAQRFYDMSLLLHNPDIPELNHPDTGKPGDIFCFGKNNKNISHIGIIVSNGPIAYDKEGNPIYEIIESSTYKMNEQESNLYEELNGESPNYKKLSGTRRIPRTFSKRGNKWYIARLPYVTNEIFS